MRVVAIWKSQISRSCPCNQKKARCTAGSEQSREISFSQAESGAAADSLPRLPRERLQARKGMVRPCYNEKPARSRGGSESPRIARIVTDSIA